MPIKKSLIERKLLYRVAKVFFLILPLLVGVGLYLNDYVSIPDISQKNIADILQKNSTLIVYAVIGLVLYFIILNAVWKIFLYIAFGGLEDDTKPVDPGHPRNQKPAQTAQLIPATIILIAVAVVYGLFQAGYIKLPKIDDLNPIQPTHTYGTACKTNDGKTGLYGTNGVCYSCSSGTAVTNPVNNNCSNGIAGVYCCGTTNDKCIPTGCGKLWRCAGSYYIGNQQISVPGMCFPIHPRNVYSSWTGTCRQCP